MLNRIRQMFSKPKSNLSDEARDFISKLAASDIWILAVGLRGTPAIPTLTDSTAFDIIAAHRIDVSEIGDDDSVFPFNYEKDGRQALPFFSSEERARHFAVEKRFPTNPTVYQPYSLLAGFVATPENDIFDLVLDPCSPAERTLSMDERLLLRSLSTAA
jgi:type III secretion system (T3SS) SseB-like protein